MGSQFELKGKGTLILDCYATYGIGIGNDYEHSYGDITIDMDGNLEIICNGTETVAIGGGFNDDDSDIKLVSGSIKVDMHTHNGIGVGSFNGDANIEISDNCKLNMALAGKRITGIGSFTGISTIGTSADITMSCSSAEAVGIGVIEDGEGSILVRKGRITAKMNAAKQACIGAIGGSVNTKIMNADIHIDSEGDYAVGIGDSEGSGNVFIMDSSINLKMACGNPRDICSADGDVQIQNSTINSLVNNKRIEHNSN
jgi:hypothetical protein